MKTATRRPATPVRTPAQPAVCPYCKATCTVTPAATNGLTPVPPNRGCEFCAPTPTAAGEPGEADDPDSSRVVIEVAERLMDGWTDTDGKRMPMYHACLKGNLGVWSAGRYPDHAIGDLVRNHPEVFGLKIVNVGRLAR